MRRCSGREDRRRKSRRAGANDDHVIHVRVITYSLRKKLTRSSLHSVTNYTPALASLLHVPTAEKFPPLLFVPILVDETGGTWIDIPVALPLNEMTQWSIRLYPHH
jgi:hypothetical protein